MEAKFRNKIFSSNISENSTINFPNYVVMIPEKCVKSKKKRCMKNLSASIAISYASQERNFFFSLIKSPKHRIDDLYNHLIRYFL